jgi:YD repeat-containing protein
VTLIQNDVMQIHDKGNTTQVNYFDRGVVVSITINWWSGDPPSKENRLVKFQHYDHFSIKLSSGLSY